MEAVNIEPLSSVERAKLLGSSLGARQQCKAKSKRTGKRCRRYANLGTAVCIMHGAKGGRPSNSLVTTRKNFPLYKQKQDYIQNREALLSLEPLIATLKIRLADFEQKVEATEHWGRAEIALLAGLSETISKIIERHHRLEQTTELGVPREQVQMAFNKLTEIIAQELSAEQAQRVIKRMKQVVV